MEEMEKIKELLIGPWPEMRFTVGETNRIYGNCTRIKQRWSVTRQSLDIRGEWQDSECTSVYEVECVKDGKKSFISFNANNPDVVVVLQA